MIWCQEPFVLLNIIDDSKRLSFMGILTIDTIMLEIKMEKHLKYLLIYFELKITLLKKKILKITLLCVSIKINFMKKITIYSQTNKFSEKKDPA